MATPIVILGLDAMRTRFEIVLGSAGEGISEGALRDAGEAALREIEEAEARLSLFRRDSLLSHINRTAGREAVRVDADTLGLLVCAREVWRLSGGAFDPTVAPRMTALGLHEGAAVPDGARMVEGGFGVVEIDEAAGTVRFGGPAALDLGAIAKGHALDLAGRVLREHGVGCALLHAGTSSVLAIGAPEGVRAWRVEVRGGRATGLEPRDAGAMGTGAVDGVCGGGRVVDLRDTALGVSGHHGRVVAGAGGAVTHVLDPRTGCPAEAVVRLAAVIAPTAAEADAWSTAVLVLGSRPGGMPVGMECLVA